MSADMDIVMAYQKLRAESHHKVTTKWVMGHADVKKKDKVSASSQWNMRTLDVMAQPTHMLTTSRHAN